MDIFWIRDPNPHDNRCGSATLPLGLANIPKLIMCLCQSDFLLSVLIVLVPSICISDICSLSLKGGGSGGNPAIRFPKAFSAIKK